MLRESHMKELKVIFGARVLSKNKDRQWGQAEGELGGRGKGRDEGEMWEERGRGGERKRKGERKGREGRGRKTERQRKERGRERGEEMKGGEGGALSYSVFEHILALSSGKQSSHRLQRLVVVKQWRSSWGFSVQASRRLCVDAPLAFQSILCVCRVLRGNTSKPKGKGEVSWCRCYSNAPQSFFPLTPSILLCDPGTFIRTLGAKMIEMRP